jgi:hypothetical protein
MDRATRERLGIGKPVAAIEKPQLVKEVQVVHKPKLPKRDKKLIRYGKLPHGSSFYCVYNADTQEWSGILIVADQQQFEATSDGVFRLMSVLEHQYVDFMKRSLQLKEQTDRLEMP